MPSFLKVTRTLLRRPALPTITKSGPWKTVRTKPDASEPGGIELAEVGTVLRPVMNPMPGLSTIIMVGVQR